MSESGVVNENGIDILVGQKWTISPRDAEIPREIVGLYNPPGGGPTQVVYVCQGHVYKTAQLHYFEHLSYCPRLGDMSGYAIVTEERKARFKKPTVCEYWRVDQQEWCRPKFTTIDWISGTIYRIPMDFSDWQEKESGKSGCEDIYSLQECEITIGYHPEPGPPYKLFEIDWSSKDNPCQEDVARGTSHWMEIGELIDGYRIFGFTDDSDWVQKSDALNSSNPALFFIPYATDSCDHYKNRKYAIGRLDSGA